MTVTALVFTAIIAQAAPSPTGASAVQDPSVDQLGHELRCPVCQGMPIAESPSDMAQAMMKRVRELHAQGKSRDEIREYFVARYGEWVLLEPEAHGFNLLVWVLPPLALLVSFVGVVLYVHRSRGKSGLAQVPTSPATLDDPYLERIRASLEKDEV